jgi:voltage-gated potassium channel
MDIKRKIYNYLNVIQEDKDLHKVFTYGMIVLILLNTFAVIIETVESIDEKYYSYLSIFEIFSVLIFAIEYLLRIWTITVTEKYRKPFTGRIRFMFTPLAIIDLLSILPFFMFAFFPFDLRFLRLFRMFRFMRLLKLGRYSHSLQLLSKVLKSKKEQLVMAFFIVSFSIIIAACFIYFAEHDAQPAKFSSIPASIYWAVMMITSIGLSDIYPITPFGHIIAMLVAVLGIGLFAIPIGIIAAGFYEETNKKKCPFCGKDLT